VTLASTDPLPEGRYWIELSRKSAVSFALWRTQAQELGLIDEERVVHDEDDPAEGWSLYVWRVLKPVHWYPDLWGWPNLADAESMDIWKPKAPGAAPRARRVARWKLAETIFVGIGTLVVATLLIQRFGSPSSKEETA
jgi:hypothetical protein